MSEFRAVDAKSANHALLISLTGPAASGKTKSALRIGTGITQFRGGPLYVIDTDVRRSLHYANEFQFKHVEFKPPFSSLRYLEAIKFCVAQGAGCIIVDSMSHEHSGIGGLLDAVEEFLDAKCKQDTDKRRRMSQVAHIEPKKARRKLNSYIVQTSLDCPIILCYQAHEKADFRHKDANGEPTQLGYQADTTSKLPYEMTMRLLLYTGSNGVPVLDSSIRQERNEVKINGDPRAFFKDKRPLDEVLGQRLARWMKDGNTDLDAASPAPSPAEPDTAQFERTELRDTILAVVKEHGIPPEHVRSIIQKIKPNAKLDDLNIEERRAVLAAVKEAA